MRTIAVLMLAASLLAGCTPPMGQTPSPATAPPLPPAATRPPTQPRPAETTLPSPAATQPSLFAPVTPADWQTGPISASVTLVIYSDFQCNYCAGLALVLKQLRLEYPDDLRLVFRHYPLPQDNKARLAAAATEAAGAQGEFWEMHDKLFETQTDWAGQTPEAFRATLGQYAQQLALDGPQFDAALASPAVAARVQAAYIAARDTPIPGTPFVLFNGTPFQDQGLTNHYALSTLIRLERLKARQLPPPPDIIDPLKSYSAVLNLQRGPVVIQLFADQAPLTVNNFVYLAQNHWYDGVTFHRVIPGFAAQAGDPSGTGYGGPGYFIPNEIVPELRFDAPGWVGMANAGPDTNGSQFFVTLAARPDFDGRFSLFGKVIQGMQLIQNLTPRDPNNDAEAPPGDSIISVTIEEK